MGRLIPAKSLVDMPVHPAAELFPMISDSDEEAMTSLVNSIKAIGQLHPIVTWNGAIIDGRNRYAACIQAGIRPRLKAVEFGSESECVHYIIGVNIHRRHLTESQRAMIASELAKLGDGQHPGAQTCAALTQSEAADQMQVSRRSVQAARKVQEDAPDLAARVKAGEIKVSKAAAMARERKRPASTHTDPDRADDKVVDRKSEDAANGYTPRMEKVWAAYSALDATEQTAFKERMGND